VYFAYVDESGDVGYQASSSKYYILSSIVVNASTWNVFHQDAWNFVTNTIKNYSTPGKNVKEIKFSDFKRGKSWQRKGITHYVSDLSTFLAQYPDITLFSVVIQKQQINAPVSNPLPYKAIELFAERVSGFVGTNDKLLIVVDNSSVGLHASWRDAIRQLKNSGNSFIKSSQFNNCILEEAMFVDSITSPEIQIADTIAGVVLEAKKANNTKNIVKSFNFCKRPGFLSQCWGLKVWP